MKIAVVGVGAVGGLLAARLAIAGHDVSAYARGSTLAAVRQQGLRLRMAGEETDVPMKASDRAEDLGEQDLVILAVKGTTLAPVSEAVQPLLGPTTMVMPAMNGVPWWFLQTPPTAERLAPADRRIASVDPDGRIEASLPLERVLGCVVHLTCSSPAPGVVQHGFGERLIVGEPTGGLSDRVTAVCTTLGEASFKMEASANIRSDIWYKLWGNMTMNPLSALTGATTAGLLDDPLVRAYILRTMAEAAEVGAQVGCPIAQSGEERMALTRQLGAFKTSMLQDALAGRPLELDALVTAVHEIGQRFGVAMPQIGTLLGLTRLMARERGLYH